MPDAGGAPWWADVLGGITPYYADDSVVIIHADCREVLPTLAPGSVDLVLTDPPYGIGLINHTNGSHAKRPVSEYAIAGDDSMEVGAAVLTLLQDYPTLVFANPMRPWLGKWRQHLVWDKGGAVGGGGDPKTCWKQTWELLQVRGIPQLNGQRDNAVLSFWVGPYDFPDHPAQKPVLLLRYLIGKATQPGQTVLDPFMGSGPTLRAAKDLGRKCIGIEIEERYCAIAAQRMAQGVLL